MISADICDVRSVRSKTWMEKGRRVRAGVFKQAIICTARLDPL